MTKTTEKLSDAAAPGVQMARERGRQMAHQVGDVISTRVMPYAEQARARARTRLRDDVAPRVSRAMRDDVAPKVAAAVGTAMVASAPLRREATARGRMAIAALRGDKVIAAAKPKRRMRKVMIVLGLGAIAGGIAAWAQGMMAGPNDDPYPTPGPDAWAPAHAMSDDGSEPQE